MNKSKIENILIFIVTTFPVIWLFTPEVRELFSPEFVSTVTPFIGVIYYLNKEWEKRKNEPEQ